MRIIIFPLAQELLLSDGRKLSSIQRKWSVDSCVFHLLILEIRTNQGDQEYWAEFTVTSVMSTAIYVDPIL